MTQNNLGNALKTLGERESGTARLEEAVAAYRAALEEWTRERVPLDWATTQNNLGNALRRSASGRAGRRASRRRSRPIARRWRRGRASGFRFEWAASFGNQGVAMMLIADRTNDGALAETAVSADRDSLRDVRDRRRSSNGRQYSRSNCRSAQAIRDRLKGK